MNRVVQRLWSVSLLVSLLLPSSFAPSSSGAFAAPPPDAT